MLEKALFRVGNVKSTRMKPQNYRTENGTQGVSLNLKYNPFGGKDAPEINLNYEDAQSSHIDDHISIKVDVHAKNNQTDASQASDLDHLINSSPTPPNKQGVEQTHAAKMYRTKGQEQKGPIDANR